MDKKPRLGSDPLSWIKKTKGKGTGKTAKKHTSKPVSQQAGKTARQTNSKTKEEDTKKATYYIDRKLIKSLKRLGIDTERDLSSLVNEAIGDLIKKYKQ